MAMFDDPRKELERLEKKLLEEEEWLARELAEARVMLGEEPAPKTKKTAKKSMDETQVYRTVEGNKKAAPKPRPSVSADTQVVSVRKGLNFEDYDVDLEEEEDLPVRKSNRGLVILACCETLGIVALVAYWLLFLL